MVGSKSSKVVDSDGAANSGKRLPTARQRVSFTHHSLDNILLPINRSKAIEYGGGAHDSRWRAEGSKLVHFDAMDEKQRKF